MWLIDALIDLLQLRILKKQHEQGKKPSTLFWTVFMTVICLLIAAVYLFFIDG